MRGGNTEAPIHSSLLHPEEQTKTEVAAPADRDWPSTVVRDGVERNHPSIRLKAAPAAARARLKAMLSELPSHTRPEPRREGRHAAAEENRRK